MKGYKLTAYVLTLVMAVALLNTASNVSQMILLSDFDAGRYAVNQFMILAEENDARVQVISAVYFFVLVLSYFVIGYWLVQANKTNRLLGGRELHFSPASTVWWHFVPFANLLMPYRTVKEIYLTSDGSNWSITDIKAASMPGFFPLWWFTWLVGNAVSQISFRLLRRMEDDSSIGMLQLSSGLDIMADILMFVCSISLLKIVLGVARNNRLLSSN